MNKLFAFLTLLLALSAQACGSAAPTPSPKAPAIPASAKPIAPPVAGFSPAEFRQLCVNFETQDSSSWKEKLDRVRKDDAEWGAKFKAATEVADLQACVDRASELEDWIDARNVAAGALCDVRRRDGGASSREFNDHAAPTRNAMNRALSAAETEKTRDGCVKKIVEAKAQFDEFLKLANEECSPPTDDQAAVCEGKAKAACSKYAAGGLQVEEANDALACSGASGRSPAPSARATNRDAGGATARTPLVGAALQTAILTGAADFFVERAEQELSLFAAEVFANKLCDEESPAREYLPNTCALLKPCKSSADEGKPTSDAGKTAPVEGAAPKEDEKCDPQDPVIGATPAALRAAAKADLDNLPANVAEKVAQKDGNLACAVAFAWGTADEVAHGAELSEVLKDPISVLERPLVKKYCKPVEDALKSLAAQIKSKLSGDPAAVADALRAGEQERLLRFDAALDAKTKAIISEILRRLVELDRAVANYRKEPSPEGRVRMVVAAVQVTIPVMTYLVDPDGAHSERRDDIYTSVDLISQVLNHDYATAIVTASNLEVVQFLPANARNLIHLAGSLAQAESSDDVRQTLEDAALPLGSWRRKNESRWGATLTGMVGFYPAYEKVVERAASDRKLTNGWTAAPALLVGVDVHHGFSGDARVGLHVNLLDLGALASIRFENPDVEDNKGDKVDADSSEVEPKSEPEVRIEQVFAPGGFLYAGVGPFDFGPAITFVPSLRPAEVSGDVKPLDVIRFGFVLAVDVSVLPLF
jgi:hypothetical protein